MKPRELIELLELEHPDQDVLLYTASSNREMQILGINATKSRELGAVVFDVDFTVKEVRVKLTEAQKQKIEKERLRKEINKLTDEEKAKLARKVRNRPVAQRGKKAQMIDEIIGPLPKGRKKETEKRGRGRPRRYKLPEELAQEGDE